MESWNIAGGTLEYFDATHTYLFNGIILPSITQIIRKKFKNKYAGVSRNILERASIKGTEVHKMIEEYELKGIDDPKCLELISYKYIKEQMGFKCISNEIPIVLFHQNKPIACGRIDLVIEKDKRLGIADIKRTSTFDREYVTYQTNLYRIGYQQTYNKKIDFLAGIHLKDLTRNYIEIPIKEEFIEKYLKKYLMEDEKNE